MLLDYPLYLTDFCLSKSATSLQSHRIQPELGYPIVPYNVYMLGSSAVACTEEKPVWAILKYCRHRSPS